MLQEHKEAYAQRGFDLAGLVTGGAGAAMMLYALSEAATVGWGVRAVVGFGFGGVALMALFVLIELRVQFPILDLQLFKRWLFTSGNLMMMPAFGAFGGFILLLTLFLQELQGYSPLQAGLIQAPSAIGTAISLPLASRIYPRVGPRRMMIGGFVLSALTMLPFLTLRLDTPWWCDHVPADAARAAVRVRRGRGADDHLRARSRARSRGPAHRSTTRCGRSRRRSASR